jgi:hypothetical protein
VIAILLQPGAGIVRLEGLSSLCLLLVYGVTASTSAAVNLSFGTLMFCSRLSRPSRVHSRRPVRQTSRHPRPAGLSKCECMTLILLPLVQTCTNCADTANHWSAHCLQKKPHSPTPPLLLIHSHDDDKSPSAPLGFGAAAVLRMHRPSPSIQVVSKSVASPISRARHWH